MEALASLLTALIVPVASFLVPVLGIFAGLALSIAAIRYGSQARFDIRASRGRQKGEGIALAGLALGWCGLALIAVRLLLVISILFS